MSILATCGDAGTTRDNMRVGPHVRHCGVQRLAHRVEVGGVRMSALCFREGISMSVPVLQVGQW